MGAVADTKSTSHNIQLMKQSTMGFTTLLMAAALLFGSATAQTLFESCPWYQSTVAYDQAFVDKMTALNSGGLITRLSNGANDPCQRLQFIDGNDFNLTFIDAGNNQRNFSSRYNYALATPSSAAYLKLNLPSRLLGADIRGNLKLYPLVARDDVIAFISCIPPTPLSLYRTEQVLVMTPYAERDTLTDDEIMTILKEFSIPKLDKLKSISTTCVPGPAAARSPLPIDMYNLVSNIANPFGGVADVALTYGSPNQSPAQASEQLMRIFQAAGITPEQFYAQTGATVIQNPAQVSYNSFQKVAESGGNPQYNYDPALQVAAMAINSAQYKNYNPSFPLQHLHQQNLPFQPYPSNSIFHHGAPFTTFGNQAAGQYASGNIHNPSVTAYSGVKQPSSSLHHHHHQTGSTSTKHKPAATVYSAITGQQPSAVSGVGYSSVQSALPSSTPQKNPAVAAGTQNVYYKF